MNAEGLISFVMGLGAASEGLGAILGVLDMAAVVVFAITGALVASRKQMDIIAFMWLGVITGIGGGTVRDLLLGVPVFWVRDPSLLVACLVASSVVYFTAHLVHSRYRLILWLDAMGLALVTIAGASKGLGAGASPVVAVVMGVITASVGGILRDILGQEPSIILRREIYVTASVVGAVLYVAMISQGSHQAAATILGGCAAFLVRALAIAYGWKMPTSHTRPARNPDALAGDCPDKTLEAPDRR